MAIFFADLVDSTVLSTRLEPETYRMLVGRYREQVRSTVDRLEGHHRLTPGRRTARRSSGHLTAHEDDVRRAVLAVLEITREVARLNEQAQRRFGLGISVRVGVHRGLVYLDRAHGDVYGLAANVDRAGVGPGASRGSRGRPDAVGRRWCGTLRVGRRARRPR